MTLAAASSAATVSAASARLDLGLVAHITATGAELSFLSLVYICSEIIHCTMYMQLGSECDSSTAQTLWLTDRDQKHQVSFFRRATCDAKRARVQLQPLQVSEESQQEETHHYSVLCCMSDLTRTDEQVEWVAIAEVSL